MHRFDEKDKEQLLFADVNVSNFKDVENSIVLLVLFSFYLG